MSSRTSSRHHGPTTDEQVRNLALAATPFLVALAGIIAMWVLL